MARWVLILCFLFFFIPNANVQTTNNPDTFDAYMVVVQWPGTVCRAPRTCKYTQWGAFFTLQGIWPVYTTDLTKNPVPTANDAISYNKVILF